MKRLLIVLVGLSGVSASAGEIAFTPPLRVVDPSVSTTTTFELRISSSSLQNYNIFDMVMGSNDLTLVGWAWGPVHPGGTAPTVPGFYTSDFKVGFFVDPAPVPIGELLGTLTVDVTGLAAGDYTVVVDGANDTGFSKLTSGLETDLLFGVGTVRVVPEPATLVLLGVVGVGVLARRPFRRRRSLTSR